MYAEDTLSDPTRIPSVTAEAPAASETDAAPKLVILHLDTERGWRGGERQALWLAKSLANRGHTSLVAGRPGEPFTTRAQQAGLEVEPFSPRVEFDPFTVLSLRALIRRRHVDIVHAHTAHAVALAALATIATSARVVVTRRVDFRLRKSFASRWKYSRAAAIIAISNAVATALVRSGIRAERITIVPDGVDLARVFEPASAESLAELGVSPGAPLVVQVSQLVGHKDPLTFVRAIAKARAEVASVQALLVGDGPLRAAVESEVARLDLHRTLHVTGYRTDADSLLAAADVVTLSSKEEGLGTVLLDAMAMGKPIAATSGGGIPEVVQAGLSGLLSPVGDPRSLGADIAILLMDPAVAARLSARARERVRQFSVERTADLTLGVYRRVLSDGDGQAERRN